MNEDTLKTVRAFAEGLGYGLAQGLTGGVRSPSPRPDLVLSPDETVSTPETDVTEQAAQEWLEQRASEIAQQEINNFEADYIRRQRASTKWGPPPVSENGRVEPDEAVPSEYRPAMNDPNDEARDTVGPAEL